MNVLDAHGLRAAVPDEPTRRHLVEVVGGPILLWIGAGGTIGAEACIAALHVARTYSACAARLVCAVVPADVRHAHRLQRQAAELVLPTVHVLMPDRPALAACLHEARAVVGAPALARAFGLTSLDFAPDALPSEIAARFVEVH